MQLDPNTASSKDQTANNVPPPLSPPPKLKSGSSRSLAVLLSLCLGLFLVDAVASLIDDSLILFYGSHVFSGLRELTSILAFLMAIGVYVLMGLTPMVPKRLFLPIPLFTLAAMLAIFPLVIYCYGQIQQIAVGLSACQVILGLAILRACLKIPRDAVFEQRAGWRGATRENTLRGSSTEEQRSQPAVCSKTLRAAGLLAVDRVGSVVTAPYGDAVGATPARSSPPCPHPKSLAAAPLAIFRQALRWAQGGIKFSWPLVPENRLGGRGFSWVNLFGFALATIFVLIPAVLIFLLLSTAMAVGHFSEGFMALHPGGFTVQVRKYVRNDGKMIELFPMAHVADAGFYQQVSQTFPSNSIILMEGVTDTQNLLTNKLSYKRMAKSLGLSEQKKEFTPTQGEMVRADVDVDQFTPETIAILNLVTLVHARGLKPEILQKLMQYSPSPEMEARLLDDLVRKRNQHLLDEIQSHLPQSDNIMVPWGVAHMPGIAKEIQKLGFHLDETHEYTVIRFGGHGNQSKIATP